MLAVIPTNGLSAWAERFRQWLTHLCYASSALTVGGLMSRVWRREDGTHRWVGDDCWLAERDRQQMGGPIMLLLLLLVVVVVAMVQGRLMRLCINLNSVSRFLFQPYLTWRWMDKELPSFTVPYRTNHPSDLSTQSPCINNPSAPVKSSLGILLRYALTSNIRNVKSSETRPPR